MECQAVESHESRDINEPHSTYKIQIFKILTCPACNSATALLYSTVVDPLNSLVESESGAPPCHKYSRQILYSPKKQFPPEITFPISEVINQAQAVLVSSPRASFILCRAVLEEICNNFQIPSKKNRGKSFRNLHDRLSDLFKKEGLPADLQNIIQGIKDLGNEGAHSDHVTFTRRVQFQEAKNLLILVNHVLEKLYIEKIRQQEAEDTLNKLKGKFLPPVQ